MSADEWTVKVHHFLGVKTVLLERGGAVPMRGVEYPESEFTKAIKSLKERAWSHGRIAEELRVNRRTVKRYTRPFKTKCTISIAGNGEDCSSKCTISTLGSGADEPGGKRREGAGRRGDWGVSEGGMSGFFT